MNEFTFEETPWERLLQSLTAGDTLSAEQLLTLTEDGESDELELALRELEERGIGLDISGLPKNFGSGEAAVRLRREEQLAQKPEFGKELDKADPLRLYLEEVRNLPRLEEPDCLAEKVLSGDEEAMAELTNGRLYRVVELACEYVGCGVLLLDLIQEGSLGLWKAARSYPGGGFAAFSDEKIRFSLASAVLMQAKDSGVGQKLRRAMEDYCAVDERLLGELGRNPTVEEIARELHMTAEETTRIGKMLTDARLLQRAEAVPQEPEDDPEAEQAVENTAYFRSRQRIAELLSELSEQDAQLLSLRFGLEGGLPLSPEDAGKRLGLTPEEALAREAQALALLRNRES